MARAPRTAPAPAKVNGFDPSAFSVEDAPKEELIRHRGSKYDTHAWIPVMTESYEQDKPKAFNPVPAEQLDDVKRDLNGVAKALGVGVRIAAHDNGDGTYRVVFTGQKRRQVTRKPLTDEQKAARKAKRAANKAAKASS